VEAAYFHSNLLVYETRVQIKWVDVTAINKSRTALLFPNAVEIHTQTNTKYGFSTLLSRDTTYTVLFKVWQNALMGKPQQGPELVRFARQMWRDDSQTGLTTEESEPENEPSPLQQSTGSVPKHSQNLRHQLHQVHMKGNNNNKDDQSTKQEGDMDISPSVEEVRNNQDKTISQEDIPSVDGKQIINEEFSLPVETMFTMLFSESTFYAAVRKERKNSNVRCGEWVPATESGAMKTRQLKYVVALNYSIGPKSAETEETQTMKCGSKPGLLYHIVCEFVSRNIPYSDSFYVTNQYCLWKVAPNRTHLRLNSCVKFKKSVWGVKSMIERNAMNGVADFSKCLISHLHSAETSSAGSTARPQRLTVPRVTASYRRRQSLAKNTRRQSVKTQRLSSSDSATSADPVFQPSESITRQYLYWIMALSILLVLFGFNVLLYSRLSTFQASLMAVEKSSADSDMHLGRQQYFYMMELDRWKAIAKMSLEVLSKINASLMAIEKQIGDQFHEDEVK
jgi:hypothetical protein